MQKEQTFPGKTIYFIPEIIFSPFTSFVIYSPFGMAYRVCLFHTASSLLLK